MKDIQYQIGNVESLTTIYGRFPSFHDAEILRLALDRGNRDEGGPFLTVEVHLFEMTRQVDPQNRFVLKNHVLAAIRFAGIRGLVLDDFNRQNVIGGLSIENSPDNQELDVAFEGIHGADVRFRCDSICVESVRPFPIDGDSSQ